MRARASSLPRPRCFAAARRRPSPATLRVARRGRSSAVAPSRCRRVPSRRLPSRELRRPLLHVGDQRLAQVVGLHVDACASASALECLRERRRSTRCRAHASSSPVPIGGPAAIVPDDLLHRVVELGRRNDRVDEPESRTPRPAHHLRGERELLRLVDADALAQQPRRAEVEAEPALGEDRGEPGPVGAPEKVRGQRQAEPRARRRRRRPSRPRVRDIRGRSRRSRRARACSRAWCPSARTAAHCHRR